jgi:hypothetical protein
MHRHATPASRDELLLWLNDRLGRNVSVSVELEQGDYAVAVMEGEGELQHWRATDPSRRHTEGKHSPLQRDPVPAIPSLSASRASATRRPQARRSAARCTRYRCSDPRHVRRACDAGPAPSHSTNSVALPRRQLRSDASPVSSRLGAYRTLAHSRSPPASISTANTRARLTHKPPFFLTGIMPVTTKSGQPGARGRPLIRPQSFGVGGETFV